jgi:hypothetical protein
MHQFARWPNLSRFLKPSRHFHAPHFPQTCPQYQRRTKDLNASPICWWRSNVFCFVCLFVRPSVCWCFMILSGCMHGHVCRSVFGVWICVSGCVSGRASGSVPALWSGSGYY